jgi:hypothetical protein
MTSSIGPRAAACRAAISALPFVDAADGAAFRLRLPRDRRARLRLHMADGWAVLTAEFGDQAVRTNPWEALALNGAADGEARLILRPGDVAVAVRAEVPLAAGEDPAPRLASACGDVRRLAAAVERRAAHEDGDTPARVPREEAAPEPPSSSEQPAVDIAALLTEAGWPFVRRASGRLAVDLELPDQFQQAFITPAADGRHLVRSTLAVAGALTPPTRNALGVLLLTVSAMVRTARGGCTDEDGESPLFFESPIGNAPSASDLDLALCAVAMACQMAGREARALIDDRIARAYLAARGWAA